MDRIQERDYFSGLYQILSKCVWVLNIQGYSSPNFYVNVTVTGFSVGDGYIMTCAHGQGGWPEFSQLEIKARRIEDATFQFHPTVVASKMNWDVVMLHISGLDGTNEKFQFGTGEVEAGDTVMMIGHPLEFSRSFYIGYAAYPGINMEEHCLGLYEDSQKCCQFKECSWPDFDESPTCRLMGHILNQDKFKTECAKNKKRKVTEVEDEVKDERVSLGPFEENLHPLLPIVQMNPYASERGNSGGPIFNIRGELIGMFTNGDQNDGLWRTHVSTIKTFYNEVMKKVEDLTARQVYEKLLEAAQS